MQLTNQQSFCLNIYFCVKSFNSMKRSLILTALILFVIYGSFAQAFTGGVLAGVVASQVAGDTYSGYNKAGVAGGAYINLDLNDTWALQMEFEYIMKGSRHLSNPNKNDLFTYKLNLSYIEIPVLVQYKLKGGSAVEFGLAGSVLISKKESLNGEDWTKIASRPGFRNQNYSLILGFVLPLNDKFKAGIRTSNSINSIRIGETSGFVRRIGNSYGQYHDLLMLSVFYRL